MQYLNTLLAEYKALILCRVDDGQWQASLEVSSGRFRISIENTPEDAVRGLQRGAPPCPVPAIG